MYRLSVPRWEIIDTYTIWVCNTPRPAQPGHFCMGRGSDCCHWPLLETPFYNVWSERPCILDCQRADLTTLVHQLSRVNRPHRLLLLPVTYKHIIRFVGHHASHYAYCLCCEVSQIRSVEGKMHLMTLTDLLSFVKFTSSHVKCMQLCAFILICCWSLSNG